MNLMIYHLLLLADSNTQYHLHSLIHSFSTITIHALSAYQYQEHHHAIMPSAAAKQGARTTA